MSTFSLGFPDENGIVRYFGNKFPITFLNSQELPIGNTSFLNDSNGGNNTSFTRNPEYPITEPIPKMPIAPVDPKEPDGPNEKTNQVHGGGLMT